MIQDKVNQLLATGVEGMREWVHESQGATAQARLSTQRAREALSRNAEFVEPYGVGQQHELAGDVESTYNNLRDLRRARESYNLASREYKSITPDKIPSDAEIALQRAEQSFQTKGNASVDQEQRFKNWLENKRKQKEVLGIDG